MIFAENGIENTCNLKEDIIDLFNRILDFIDNPTSIEELRELCREWDLLRFMFCEEMEKEVENEKPYKKTNRNY